MDKDIPMIPKYQAENMAMHLGRANRNLAIVVIAICVAFCVAIILIINKFVDQYTSRTDRWLATLSEVVERLPSAEVTNGPEADP